MKLKYALFFAAVFLLFTAFVFCSGEPSETFEVDGVYSFSLQYLNGEPADFTGLRGKVVLLNVWATWCSPCVEEMPIFIRLYDKYKDKGLEIWGVSTDIGGKSVVEPFIEEKFAEHGGINYPIILSDENKIRKIFRYIIGYPTTFLFDAEGRIVRRLDGVADTYVDESKGETVETWFEKQIVDLLPSK